MKHYLFFVGSILFFNFTLTGQSSFRSESIQNNGGATIQFRMLEPEKVKKNKKYPLVIFLHGSGEKGSDNTKQLVHGSTMFETKKNRRKYPAYVIFPQCPEKAYWESRDFEHENKTNKFLFDYSGAPSFPLREVFSIINYYKKMPHVDSNRIYIMGLSMGGMGTFEAISRHPELFAAAVPICGGADLRYVKNFATRVKVWIFHGAQDDQVLPKYSREVVDKIIQEGGFPKYTEFPTANHNSWDPAFKTEGLFKWLFSQKRSINTNN